MNLKKFYRIVCKNISRITIAIYCLERKTTDNNIDIGQQKIL